ncbi:MAG: type III-A CRISPR-associated protein Cas10/Csm1 [Sutterellaceae bacterium]|nr:type III-A CRISPR-associated protein Cas10/Csm1 [Burkholderiaceae bacterium]MDW8430204.1 type III-A CRISPR-associated protein Cas10/Csm1 [Sutterellaceae bacterium]
MGEINSEALLQASSRVALAAYLHDIGKFAERAGAFDNDPRLDAHLMLYCPCHEEGPRRWFTHRHAAYSALAFDLIENHLPDLVTHDVWPFTGRVRSNEANKLDATDSLINAAAAHHKPETFLQWVIATADRVASGFEREEFEQYNRADDETELKLDHFCARQLTLFEQLRLNGAAAPAGTLRWRYPLKPLSARAVFPALAEACESRDRARAKGEYRQLWDGFVKGLEKIPRNHRRSLPLWLDHFDSLWLTFTHAIPAATAFNVKPEVSLYDHSRATAALAVALWRWHEANRRTGPDAAAALRERADYSEPKLLLIQGDFFGIQNFIFAAGGETRKQAAKLLRGRSFQVSLFTEIAALRILDELALPPTSQVMNAAGKFLIVAPNTKPVRENLEGLRKEFDRWFLDHSFGLAGIGLAWLPACCNDFLRGAQGGVSPYAELTRRLRESLDYEKHRRFDLCATGARVFHHAFPYGVCEYNGWLPADKPRQGDVPASCRLSRDQIAIGEALVRFDRVLVLREDANAPLRSDSSTQPLELDLFGYRIAFTESAEASGAFGPLAESGALRRCWDFSAADRADASGESALWSGYARRFISGYVPEVDANDRGSLRGRYAELTDEEIPAPGGLKPLDMLACEDRHLEADGETWLGVEALGVLKGDIDDLGELFRVGLGSPTFAKTAALSRQVNSFFAIYLPWLLSREFRSVYTVFAGGDDFFLIGPWRTVQRLAERMRREFTDYVAQNPQIHFSAGIATQKPGASITALAELAEAALEKSKMRTGKDAITCFGETVGWSDWPSLEDALKRLENLRQGEGLTSGYVYGLLEFVDLRQREQAGDPHAALWRPRFAYRTRRYVVDKRRNLDESARERLFGQVAGEFSSAIDQLGSSYRIVLFNHLYQYRSR